MGDEDDTEANRPQSVDYHATQVRGQVVHALLPRYVNQQSISIDDVLNDAEILARWILTGDVREPK